LSKIVEQLEAQYEKPLAQILMDLYAEHQDVSKVAKILGVKQPTITYWIKTENLIFRKALIPVEYHLTEQGHQIVRAMRANVHPVRDNAAIGQIGVS
jgi:predicted transcriptional regulator